MVCAGPECNNQIPDFVLTTPGFGPMRGCPSIIRLQVKFRSAEVRLISAEESSVPRALDYFQVAPPSVVVQVVPSSPSIVPSDEVAKRMCVMA
jgi:hypothetical protein